MSAQSDMPWASKTHEPGPGLNDDPTPRLVARAILGEALPQFVRTWKGSTTKIYTPGSSCARPIDEAHPFRVLGIGSGYGCWESEFAKWWVDVLELPREWLHITAVEVNPDREEHLRKWCDEVVIEGWREFLARSRVGSGGLLDAPEQWDAIIGNPPFSHVLRAGKRWDPEAGTWGRTDYMDVDETMVPVLRRHGRAVLLLHTAGAFDDSEHGREVWRRYQPAAEWKCGRISFREGGKKDSRPYITSLWLRRHEGATRGYMLPKVLEEDRKWTDPPGSEDAATALAEGLPMVGGS